MKVAVYYSNADIRIEDRPVPEIGAGELLIAMKACGICGTDVMEWYRKPKAPRVLGHEMAGEIVQIGEGVSGLRVGDRVFVSHHVPCFNCRYCETGRESACQTLHAGNYDPGGFAEFIRVPELNVRHGTFTLPNNISFEEAAMIEPLACAVAGQKRLSVAEGQTVLIIGAGISGLCHIRLSVLSGAKVIASDINPARLEKASGMGAAHVLDAAAFSADRLKELNGGRLADAVIVCAGAEKAAADAFESVDKRGAILFFAVPPRPLELPSVRFWREEISVLFSYGAAAAEIKEALDLIAGGRFAARDMISHVLPLSRITEGFNLVAEANDSLKVVVVPD
ncbi:alcohol dehydrogenase catalytic domain-containing protein [Dehalogenimonas alkenigignens]|uniref:Threonine dehydrogenase or related Zn-dependent dehydrogenase n=1 Tax=Dehalogenimonas alkenigignens TaxID=1217799 RepID=A0A0W0GHC7_9CHLR|nr:alcohol dehydrogenase catalytic domain-containing protein [Dehalogenimonas alkenigignens]KTB47958.1 Threonine dehydrogenase or related Zn-dependent dehydrogenase [Dehalogenimonas alkenigignens]PVV83222.1 alcohol dehydrogenase [Dehalogenimonas alkenigignens]